jgi:hypothetical protein
MHFINPTDLTIAQTAEHFGCEDILLDAITMLRNQDACFEHINASKVKATKRKLLGFFKFKSREISLTCHPRQSEEHARNTFLHECAHMLDFYTRSTSDHSEHWRRWARFLGCNPRSSAEDQVWMDAYHKANKRRVTMACLDCGETWQRQRRRDFGAGTHSGCREGQVVNVFDSAAEARKFSHYRNHFSRSKTGILRPIAL